MAEIVATIVLLVVLGGFICTLIYLHLKRPSRLSLDWVNSPLRGTVLQWFPEAQFKELYESGRIVRTRQVERDSLGNYYFRCFVKDGPVKVEYPDYSKARKES